MAEATQPQRTQRRPRRIAGAKEQVAAQQDAPVQAAPTLAVWRCTDVDGDSALLPTELAAQAITHYSDPGDLILLPPGHDAVAAAARSLNRRPATATPKPAAAADDRRRRGAPLGNVLHLRPRELAALAIARLPGDAGVRAAAAIASTLARRLKPGGFLIIALVPPDRLRRRTLGPLVAAGADAGLQYWQHVIAIDRHARGAVCDHLDVLVFRRPEQAGAAAVLVAAAVADAGRVA